MLGLEQHATMPVVVKQVRLSPTSILKRESAIQLLLTVLMLLSYVTNTPICFLKMCRVRHARMANAVSASVITPKLLSPPLIYCLC